MTCPSCGAADLAAGAAFCPGCGAKLAAAKADAAPAGTLAPEVAPPAPADTHIDVNVAAGNVAGGRVAGVAIESVAGNVTIIHQAGAGAAEAAEDLTVPSIKRQPWEPETVLVPAGAFTMGSAPGEGIPEDETPAHAVDLPACRIGRHPVTNREYGEFIRQTRHEPPNRDLWFNREPTGRLDHPVTDVTWHDAVAYCRWLGERTGRRYRLPSEAEWEKAARGTDGRRFPWGDAWADGRCNAGGDGTTPASAFPEGASACGCLDLLGNAQEWTCSLWGKRPMPADFRYPYDPADGREVTGEAGPPPQARLVHRGGSYKSPPGGLRCSQRGQSDPASKIGWRGFRVALSAGDDR